MDQDLEVENGEYHQEEEVLTAIFFLFFTSDSNWCTTSCLK